MYALRLDSTDPAFNLALAHDHTFRQMANLTILVFESFGSQPSQVRLGIQKSLTIWAWPG